MQKSKRSAAHSAALEEQFLAAYDEHADALFRHCFVRIRDRELAKDIVQETFTKTWMYLSEGKKIEYLRAFLFRVANNLIIDSSRRRKSSSLDSMIDDDGFEVVDESAKNPAEVPDARAAMQLLNSLDSIYRTVITMRYVDGLTPKEIASILTVSENVVSVRIHRGILQLRERIHRKGKMA